jgi:hypothetical protein
MLSVLWLAFGSLLRIFRNRRDLIFENFVLRQQLAVLKRRRFRPALNLFDKLFWVAVSRLWSQWKQALIVVSPQTVVRWQRAGFRMYWEADLPSPGAGWAKADTEGGAGVDLPHGGGEPHLGSATHPGGTADARVRHLGTDDLPLDETSAEGPQGR